MSENPRPGNRALRKGRHSQAGQIYFITVCTHQGRTRFNDHRLARMVSRMLHQDKTLYDAEMLCWVVMPDHVHFLMQLGKTPLQKIISQWKSKSARLLNRQLARTGQFWQAGYYDHALRKEQKAREIARYIIGNPLRAGLTRKYAHYPYWNAKWL